MATRFEEIDGGKTLEVSLTGKLVKEDYEIFVPAGAILNQPRIPTPCWTPKQVVEAVPGKVCR